MDKLKLQEMVLAFVAIASKNILMSDDGSVDKAQQLDTTAILKTWVHRPDCHLSPMFLGYALGQGIDINTFSYDALNAAVQSALIGETDVNFDWLGDINATHKPH